MPDQALDFLGDSIGLANILGVTLAALMAGIVLRQGRRGWFKGYAAILAGWKAIRAPCGR